MRRAGYPTAGHPVLLIRRWAAYCLPSAPEKCQDRAAD
jgi:hypothetical protein